MKDVIENLDSAMQMFKAGKPPAGFVPIPNSKHGGYHKRTADGWQTWYPGDAKPKETRVDPTKTIGEMAAHWRLQASNPIHDKKVKDKPLPLRYGTAADIAKKHPDLIRHPFHEGVKVADEREPGRYINIPSETVHESNGHRVSVQKLDPAPHDPTPYAVHHDYSDPHDESRPEGKRRGRETFYAKNEKEANEKAGHIVGGIYRPGRPAFETIAGVLSDLKLATTKTMQNKQKRDEFVGRLVDAGLTEDLARVHVERKRKE